VLIGHFCRCPGVALIDVRFSALPGRCRGAAPDTVPDTVSDVRSDAASEAAEMALSGIFIEVCSVVSSKRLAGSPARACSKDI